MAQSSTTRGGRQGRLYYGTQVAVRPPSFTLFVNEPKLFGDTYRRYVERQIRQGLGFEGSPVRLFWRGKQQRMPNGIRPVLPAANGLAAAASPGPVRGWPPRLAAAPDPRLKYAWSLAFLLTPILASAWWRLALVGLLLLITLGSGLPWRLWRRSVPLLLALSLAVGLLASVLPSPREQPQPVQRPPQELQLAQPLPPPPAWELWHAGPLRITRRSAELGVNSATLLFTVMQSANLLLVSTPPEALAWGLTALLAPLGWLGVPVERLGFQLLLALRFLPLVQEELQNLLRAVATRALNLKQLGWRGATNLVLAVGERLLANVLLRAEQGAEALQARGGQWRARPSCDYRRRPPLGLNALALEVCCCWWQCAGATAGFEGSGRRNERRALPQSPHLRDALSRLSGGGW